MSDDTTFPGVARRRFADTTDITNDNLITDFTQVVSCAVGKGRRERKRLKIREELIRDHIDSGQQLSPSLITQFFKLFRRS